MAVTYESIATTTMANSSTTSVTFNSFSGYTDLVLVTSTKSQGGYDFQNSYLTFNGDTGTNYSYTALQGDGSSASSNRQSNVNGIPVGFDIGTTQSGKWSVNIISIMNYSNSSINKTVIARKNANPSLVSAIAGLWRSTAAITSLTLSRDDSNGYTTGSTFTLYGIKAA